MTRATRCFPVILITASTGLTVAACAVEPETSATQSAIHLDTTNQTTRSKQCEGYTTGGGQRVRGIIALQTSPVVVGGQQMFDHTVGVEASNWEKNIFGWNTKRTAEMSVTGTVTLSTPAGGNTFSFSFDSGGNLTTRIGDEVARLRSVNSFAEVYGNVTFNGRHGTTCSL